MRLKDHLMSLGIKVIHVPFGDHDSHFYKDRKKDEHEDHKIFFVDPTNDRIYKDFIDLGYTMLPGMSFYFQPEFFNDKHFWSDRSLYTYICKDTGFKFGGKSYDTMNRNKLPVDLEYSDEFPVEPYTETFGDIEQLGCHGSGNIYFPVDRKGALLMLDRFLAGH